jgi:alpha-galactosidase
MKRFFLLGICALAFFMQIESNLAAAQAVEVVWLSSLDLSKMSSGRGIPRANQSVVQTPIQIGRRSFSQGVGVHARSVLWVDLGGTVERFTAWVGVDSASLNRRSSVQFKVAGDGKLLWQSGFMRRGNAPRRVDLALNGVRHLVLVVTDGGDGEQYDFADWADARFLVKAGAPSAMERPVEETELLTPVPANVPRINGPSVYGCRPGHFFLYRIPATGRRPMEFSVSGLPAGLELDHRSGIITGSVPKRGKYEVELKASNRQGSDKKAFRIVCGDQLALTPPMGWNHWYAHYERITDQMMRDAADAMISSGMADVGYQYVSIDDCWMNAPEHEDPLRVGPLRDDQGNILPNKHFPDMKALTDYIHSKGLKAGIYTSPGPLTCAGFAGSYQHEAQDAEQFADWGFDFLKYDWCSYERVVKSDHSLESLQKPYWLMGKILEDLNRDIVLNLCQYGWGRVWEWGGRVGGHSWRTAGDLGYELDRIFEVALENARHRSYSKPGNWNDPDYLQIGYVGDTRGKGMPKPCPLSPNEQYAYMSIWALMASPLFYSGDMTRLEELTLNVLTNPEVIDVNQDPLGESGRVFLLSDDTFVMIKRLVDGSSAAGFFNRGEIQLEITLDWKIADLDGEYRIRDLWRQQELGNAKGQFTASVPPRGVCLVRLQNHD